jgi:hypothetical protein
MPWGVRRGAAHEDRGATPHRHQRVPNAMADAGESTTIDHREATLPRSVCYARSRVIAVGPGVASRSPSGARRPRHARRPGLPVLAVRTILARGSRSPGGARRPRHARRPGRSRCAGGSRRPDRSLGPVGARSSGGTYRPLRSGDRLGDHLAGLRAGAGVLTGDRVGLARRVDGGGQVVCRSGSLGACLVGRGQLGGGPACLQRTSDQYGHDERHQHGQAPARNEGRVSSQHVAAPGAPGRVEAGAL